MIDAGFHGKDREPIPAGTTPERASHLKNNGNEVLSVTELVDKYPAGKNQRSHVGDG